MKRTSARKNYIDVARGLGILLVIIGHALEAFLDKNSGSYFGSVSWNSIFHLWKFIYSFHMPFFFVLSGVAMTRLAELDLKKVFSGTFYLILIAAALQLLFAPVRLALPLPGDHLPSSLAGTVVAVVWPAIKLEGYALVVIWFLPCLALVRLAVWLVGNAGRRAAATWLALLGGLCLAAQTLDVGYFQMRTVIVGMALFWIGQCIGDLSADRWPRPACWLIGALALAVTVFTFDANHGCSFSAALACRGPGHDRFAVVMASGAFGFLPLFALTALSGSVAVLGAAILLADAPGARWLILIGRRTLELLIVNGAVLVFVEPRMPASISTLPPALVVTGFVLVQLAIALLIHPVLDRFLALAARVGARLARRVSEPLLLYLSSRAAIDPNGVPT